MIELRLLRYFLAVAETEHVGRAAQRLHISQSPLSRQIRQLEELLGVELFTRDRRRIRLTPNGRWLLGAAREVVARSDALVHDARALGSGEGGQLAIGFVGAALTSGLLPSVLRRLRRERPAIRVVLRQLRSDTQLMQLRAGEIDLALVHRAPRVADLVVHQLAEQPYVLAVPRDSSLARRPVRAAQLDGQPWIVVAADDDTGDRWATGWRAAGFTPDVVVRVAEWASALAQVGAGIGLALVPESYTAGRPRDVAIRRLPWLTMTSGLSLVRRRTSDSRLIEDVAHWIADASRSAPPPAPPA